MTPETLQSYLQENIPLVYALQLQVEQLGPDSIELRAPLSPNRNDKGTAFAGSLASLLTLAGWGLIHAHVPSGTQVAVHTLQTTYHRPVECELHVEAILADDAHWERFDAQLARRGRARLAIQARALLPDGTVAASTHGSYAAWRNA